ncbi:MAG: hypothetical protein EHM70_04375 [Chloroflexota bacterium]|nr:MAG: hypothetical protein EHM70_04375 [Chloroflexota bacterium]
MLKKSAPVFALAFLLVAVFLGGCSLPSAPGTAAPTPGVTHDLIYTAAVETVVAQLTLAAPTLTLQPAEPTASLTPEPPTETPLPINTLPPTVTSTPEATPTPTNPPPSATAASSDPKLTLGSPTWTDSFDDDENWSLSTDEHTKMEVNDGKLEMTAFNADYWDGWAITWPDIEDVYIEVVATTGACSGLDRYGIMLRTPSDASEGYLFGFSCDGRYSFRKWDGEDYTVYADWTANSAILAGSNQTNRMGLRAEGDEISLYANGVLLREIEDDSYSSGNFGVFIGAANTAGFITSIDELSYWDLE